MTSRQDGRTDDELRPVVITRGFTSHPAGSVLIKTWKATGAGDTALVAASTFGKKVNYIAWGV